MSGGDYVWLDVHDGNRYDRFRRNTAGPFEVLNRTTWNLFSQREKVVERVHSDRVVKEPAPED